MAAVALRVALVEPGDFSGQCCVSDWCMLTCSGSGRSRHIRGECIERARDFKRMVAALGGASPGTVVGLPSRRVCSGGEVKYPRPAFGFSLYSVTCGRLGVLEWLWCFPRLFSTSYGASVVFCLRLWEGHVL